VTDRPGARPSEQWNSEVAAFYRWRAITRRENSTQTKLLPPYYLTCLSTRRFPKVKSFGGFAHTFPSLST